MDLARRVGADLALHVTARDGLYLRPQSVNRAAAARFRSAVLALLAYVRRLIVTLALQMEHQLVEAPPRFRPARRGWPGPAQRIRILVQGRGWPGGLDSSFVQSDGWAPKGRLVPTASLFAQLDELAELIRHPVPRARRLAWHFARRARFVGVPDFGARLHLRGATEGQTVFMAMGRAIQLAALARPPSMGPAPRPPPRVRRL